MKAICGVKAICVEKLDRLFVGEDIDGQALKEDEIKSLIPKLGHVKKVLRLQSSVTESIIM